MPSFYTSNPTPLLTNTLDRTLQLYHLKIFLHHLPFSLQTISLRLFVISLPGLCDWHTVAVYLRTAKAEAYTRSMLPISTSANNLCAFLLTEINYFSKLWKTSFNQSSRSISGVFTLVPQSRERALAFSFTASSSNKFLAVPVMLLSASLER